MGKLDNGLELISTTGITESQEPIFLDPNSREFQDVASEILEYIRLQIERIDSCKGNIAENPLENIPTDLLYLLITKKADYNEKAILGPSRESPLQRKKVQYADSEGPSQALLEVDLITEMNDVVIIADSITESLESNPIIAHIFAHKIYHSKQALQNLISNCWNRNSPLDKASLIKIVDQFKIDIENLANNLRQGIDINQIDHIEVKNMNIRHRLENLYFINIINAADIVGTVDAYLLTESICEGLTNAIKYGATTCIVTYTIENGMLVVSFFSNSNPVGSTTVNGYPSTKLGLKSLLNAGVGVSGPQNIFSKSKFIGVETRLHFRIE